MLAIQNFQQRLYAHYKKDLSLPPTYRYLHGNPVEPVVPLHDNRRPVCLIGPFPEARLGAIGSEPAVPVGNICRPFPDGVYFDGRQVRGQARRDRLTERYLAPLGLSREQCWLTYLVKVFLFKDEHLARYRRLGCPWPEWETRSRFDPFAQQSLGWLAEELALVRPRLVITLGAEVAQVLQAVPGVAVGESLVNGQLRDLWLDEHVYPVLHLAEAELDAGLMAHARNVIQRLLQPNR